MKLNLWQWIGIALFVIGGVLYLVNNVGSDASEPDEPRQTTTTDDDAPADGS